MTRSSTTTKPSDPGDVPFEAVLVFAAIVDAEPNPTAAIASAAVELTKTISNVEIGKDDSDVD